MVNQEAFPSSNRCVAVVVAGGAGTRMAELLQPPKQFRPLLGKPVVRWSVEALLRCDKIEAVVVVTPVDDNGRMAGLLPADPRLHFTIGGNFRSESVRNGLGRLAELGAIERELEQAWDKVLIHDAARPGLSLDVIEELIAALDTADAAAPALAMTDAVKERDASGVRAIERDRLVRVQTPQAMRWPLALETYPGAANSAVDDLALLEGTDARITFTPGRLELMKITHKEDIAVMEKLLATSAAAMRIGNGFDVHGFEPGDAVILCGVKIPHTKKLEGHSDADAGWHALTDAILGAAALGDIGDHFPPSDPRWKGQDSRTFLVHAVKLAAERGFSVVNADITLMCEKPRISTHREAMRQRTAEALGIDLDRVSVKATTTEKLGFLGREEGIAAQAVVLLAGA